MYKTVPLWTNRILVLIITNHLCVQVDLALIGAQVGSGNRTETGIERNWILVVGVDEYTTRSWHRL